MSAFATAATMALEHRNTGGERRFKAVQGKASPTRNSGQDTHCLELRLLLDRYDKDRSGTLNAKELSDLLENERDDSISPKLARRPTDDEVKCIIRTAAAQNNDAVNICEIDNAIYLWRSYLRNQDIVDALFFVYDTKQKAFLDFHDFKRYLASLNGGLDPQDADVNAILDAVHSNERSIEKIQLTLATTLWHRRVEFQDRKCCVIG
mmetsp:Transcript_7969/g.23968  ORF Transcript_7969/g.23968 Transcript_7969/m.23968 type:complete len:207 (+) Transcript_7969:3-623(+)